MNIYSVLTVEIPGLQLVEIQVANEVQVDLHGAHLLRQVVSHQFFICGVEPKPDWHFG
jgi:hypothetical protein